MPECDRRRDGRNLCSGYTSAFIACYATALVNMDKLTAAAPLTMFFARVIVLSVSFLIATYCTYKTETDTTCWRCDNDFWSFYTQCYVTIGVFSEYWKTIVRDNEHAEHRLWDKKVSKADKPARYAFTSSQFSFYARHILPTSKFQYSYSCIILIFYRHQ